jgi:TRAP-type C4-dicarboxylate transport system substrate-binding protein
MKRAILIKRKGNGLRRFLLAALGFVVFSFASPELLRAASEAESQSQSKRTITINLASALPRNSEWGRALDKLAADWIRITGGEVTLNILHQYPGSEGDYLM